MSCSPFDLRDYWLKELTEPEQRQVEQHVRGCQDCRDEMDRLRLTEAALLALREEEIPQRIGFVSDKVFEPSPWRKAWAAFWGSAARLGFASAAMLSAALVYFAVTRPAPAPVASVAPVAAVSNAEIDRRVQAAMDQAVARAVAASEAQSEQKIAQLAAEIRRKDEKAFAVWADSFLDYSRRRELVVQQASGGWGPPRVQVGDER